MSVTIMELMAVQCGGVNYKEYLIPFTLKHKPNHLQMLCIMAYDFLG